MPFGQTGLKKRIISGRSKDPFPCSFTNIYGEMNYEIKRYPYAINGAVFEVNDILGPGFLEKVYENALLVEFKRLGLKAKNQVPIKVSYKGEVVGDFTADLLVEDEVIVELKTVENLDRAHEAQLLNYLKATDLHVGLLVNFKHIKADIKRMVLDLPEDEKG